MSTGPHHSKEKNEQNLSLLRFPGASCHHSSFSGSPHLYTQTTMLYLKQKRAHQQRLSILTTDDECGGKRSSKKKRKLDRVTRDVMARAIQSTDSNRLLGFYQLLSFHDLQKGTFKPLT